MDQIVGRNIIRLREQQGLNLRDCADILSRITGDGYTAAKLSRWETGQYHFTFDDLYVLSLIYGVGLQTLMKPHREVTDVIVGDATYPVVEYRHDFLIGPSETFTDRATTYAQANSTDTAVIEALNDVDERLGHKAGLGDVEAEIKAVGVKVGIPAVKVVVTDEDGQEVST
jgi:transcriptional regulator with XRE-family HTH domain